MEYEEFLKSQGLSESAETTNQDYSRPPLPAEEFEVQQGQPPDSLRPLNGQDERKDIPLRGMERDLAGFSPNAYATLRSIMDLVPYASLALVPSKQEEFIQMSQQEQTRTLLYEALGAVMWPAAKSVGEVGKLGARYLGLWEQKLLHAPLKRLAGKSFSVLLGKSDLAKVLPYEDAFKKIGGILGKEKFKEFSYADELKRKLLNRGYALDEADGMVSALTKEQPDSLTSIIMDRKLIGKEMTKAFEAGTLWERGRLYPKRVLTEKAGQEFGEETIRAKFYNNQFTSILQKEVLHTEAEGVTIESIFKAHRARVYPHLEGEVNWGTVTPTQMMNITSDMISNKAVSWQTTYPITFASLHPARVVLGYGEKFLNTYTKFYEKGFAAVGATNRSYFNHSLLFAKMLEQVGIYEKVAIKKTGEFSVKKAKWFTAGVQDEAHRVLRKMDDLASVIRKGGEQVGIDALIVELAAVTKGVSPGAKGLISVVKRYFDHLYSDHTVLEIPTVFRKIGLTRIGQAEVDRMLTGVEGINYHVDDLFSSIANKTNPEKIIGMKKLLESVRKRFDFEGNDHPYFNVTKDKAKNFIEDSEVMKNLFLGVEKGGKLQGDKLRSFFKIAGKDLYMDDGTKEGGKFLAYLDDYTARVGESETLLVQKWRRRMFGDMEAAYVHSRKLDKMGDTPVDLGTMVEARTMGLAKQHFLYDKMGEMADDAVKLPPAFLNYVDSYMNGILNTPTMNDHKLAIFFTKYIGGVERGLKEVSVNLGGEGLWNEQRIRGLGQTINSLIYLGGLGFKTFSAARQLFQPLIGVAADMGGVRDLGKLAEGYIWACVPKNRAYIRAIGAIEEYAPEIYLRPRMLPQGTVIRGKEIPTLDQVRDIGLWMFKGGDRYARYTAGGAAVIKWDRALRSFGGKVEMKDVTAFSRKMNLEGRYEWVNARIKDALYRGKLEEAKKMFVIDVIKDTQYAFGVADAPTILRTTGTIGKVGFLFQSWWMNYGTMIEKWLTVGTKPERKAERVITALLSQTIAYHLMEPIWGRQSAMRANFFGPFPSKVNEFLVPPGFAPIYHAGAALLNIQQMAIADDWKTSISAQQAKAALDSTMIFVPGGLQIQDFYKGAKVEGFEGFSKAIIGIKAK